MKHTRALTIFDAVKRFGWPEPGSKIISREILLGESCNARCLFCCARNLIQNTEWLPAETVIGKLRKAIEEDAWLITFSGGEASLYPDMNYVASEAKKVGFKSVQVLTNGLKLSDIDFVRGWADAGIDEVKISLHGIDPWTHDYLMDIPGAFANSMAAVENLNRCGIKASFNFAVTRVNYKQMPLFAKLAGVDLGVTGFCFMFSFYSGGMLEYADRLNVSYTEAVPYLRTALRYMKIHGVVIESKMLSNFVPCVAPELMNLMSDWRNTSVESSSELTTSADMTRRMSDNYPERKMKLPSCAGCVFRGSCYGVDKGYVAIHGAGEFRPLKAVPSVFPYSTLYP
mgnify:CR=1 FL=1